MEEEGIFVAGIIRLNGEHAPFIEILIDSANGRADGEMVLLKQIANSGEYYSSKLIDEIKKETVTPEKPKKKRRTGVIHFSDRAKDKAKQLGVFEELKKQLVVLKHLGYGDPKEKGTAWDFNLIKHPKTKKLTVYLTKRKKR